MHSLLSPSDARLQKANSDGETKPYVPKLSPPLTDAEVTEAVPVLLKDVRFTQTDRYYADPLLPQQRFTLVSFVPSSGARPDADNIYGMMKVRGVFATEEEANERAEFLVRNVDSYHDIYHAYVGRPFPVTSSEAFSRDIRKIDIRKKTTDVISDDIMRKKEEERKEVLDIQDRERRLLEESKAAASGAPRDPFDVYITEQVKRAQLMWTYRETMIKVDQMKKSFGQSTDTIKEMNDAHPDFIDKYREHYMRARREAGIPDNDDSFLKYLGAGLDMDIDNLPLREKNQPEIDVLPDPKTATAVAVEQVEASA